MKAFCNKEKLTVLDEFCNWLESPESDEFLKEQVLIGSVPQQLTPV
jgi:hypothetical protein